ncbi:MAG: hypothetical protein JRI39_13990 [Deltaproteobacteria bacterium]|nr:hypothetical protein [Deltaproteobacteria bacterium]
MDKLPQIVAQMNPRHPRCQSRRQGEVVIDEKEARDLIFLNGCLDIGGLLARVRI